MRKILCLLAAFLFLPVYAMAATDADQYLTAGPWEMTVYGFDNVSYMNFDGDGTGFMAIPTRAVNADGTYQDFCQIYNFVWSTLKDGNDYFINVFFEGEYPGYGWGCLHAPHKFNTYQLLWSTNFMLFNDTTHPGLDAKGHSADKSMTLYSAPFIPYISSNPNGGSGAFGGGGMGSR